MQTAYASETAPGRVNEDYAAAGADWAMVLDGATTPAGAETGCSHGVPWLVRRVAASLTHSLTLGRGPLSGILATAIEEARSAHAGTCDLRNPDSPSTTVSIVRVCGGNLEYLTLGDSPIVVWQPGGAIRVFLDDRVEHLPGGRPYRAEMVRSLRNTPEGFWVAGTVPDAAYRAVTGTAELSPGTESSPGTEVALFTDGVTRLVDFFGYSWEGLFSQLRTSSPQALIAAVRRLEHQPGVPYGKRHDDATAVHLTRLTC